MAQSGQDDGPVLRLVSLRGKSNAFVVCCSILPVVGDVAVCGFLWVEVQIRISFGAGPELVCFLGEFNALKGAEETRC